MSDEPPLVFSREMEPMDYLMFRGEAEPRSRTSMLSVAALDSTPDFERLRSAFDRASRIVLRLRQRVVVPTLPVGAPQWIVDPDFDLDYHVRRIRVPAPGTIRQVLDLAQPMLAAPLDIARPLWEATLVEGLSGEEGAEAALVLKLNHSITDGVGGVRLFRELYDLERDADRGPMPPLPVPVDVTPNELTRQAARRLPVDSVASGVSRLTWALRTANSRRCATRAARSRDASRMIGSARRVLGPPPVEPSPLMRRRGLGRRFEYLEFPLTRIRAAAKAAGGSVNDAYLAGICGALRLYHDALGVPVDAVPLAMPVNLRTDDDPAGGNRFAGARVAVPVSITDPVERIRVIREQVLSVVSEPAISVMSAAAPVLMRLPESMLGAVSSMVSSTDVQASNVPGFPEQPFIAGAKILKTLPFGPLPGVAMMIVMISEAGTCFVGVHYDTASVTEADLFVKCLQRGLRRGARSGRRRHRHRRQAGPEASNPPQVDRQAQPLAPSVTAGTRGDPEMPSGVPPPATTPSPRPRVPGTVAEIEASPRGPEIGAFFDLDGTVILGFSAQAVAQERLRRREVGAGELFRLGRLALAAGIGRAGFADLLAESALALRGRRDDELGRDGRATVRPPDLRPRVPGGPRPRRRPPGAGAYRRPALVGDRLPGRAGRTGPRDRARRVQPARGPRRRAHRRARGPVVWGESKADRGPAVRQASTTSIWRGATSTPTATRTWP